MYNTSPAFSIAGKYHKVDKQIKPTPVTYHHQNWNPTKTPSWKIGSDKKSIIHVNSNPGPGHYDSFKPDRSNKFGIIGKQNSRAKVNTQKSPSPTSYSPNLIDRSPQISFAKKYPPYDNNSYKPGPGAYQNSNTITINRIGPVIGKQKRFVGQKQSQLVPGPGSYEYKCPSSAKVSFGKEMRNCGRKLSTKLLPGPGQYEQKSLFQSSMNLCKGFSLATKTIIKDLETKPGPGNYDPDYKKIYLSNPSFSIPSKHKPVNTDQTSGPNTYQIKVFHTSQYTPFAKSKRQPFLNNKDVPGPGQYQTQKIMKLSPNFSLGASRKNDLREDFPGPGTYTPDKNLLKTRPQSAKIGRSPRFTDKTSYSPGPGQYEVIKKSRPTTPAHSFGKDCRMKLKTSVSPGPGQYSIPSSVAYLPSYACK